jgi:hypothetical protein
MTGSQSCLVPAAWHRWVAVGDGSRVRVVAGMGWYPLARVDVEDRADAVTITLFQRVPRVAMTDEDVGIPAIGIAVCFDVPLGAPQNGRRVIDGATGKDPERLPAMDPDREFALDMDVSGQPPVVPVGREFSWLELTGTPWRGRRSGSDVGPS